ASPRDPRARPSARAGLRARLSRAPREPAAPRRRARAEAARRPRVLAGARPGQAALGALGRRRTGRGPLRADREARARAARARARRARERRRGAVAAEPAAEPAPGSERARALSDRLAAARRGAAGGGVQRAGRARL